MNRDSPVSFFLNEWINKWKNEWKAQYGHPPFDDSLVTFDRYRANITFVKMI